MNMACKRELKSMRHTMSEASTKNPNLTMDRLINRWWKLPILVFSLLVLGIFFTPAKSVAQAVPPRSQTLQLIRPLVPPPEPPLEKKIRQNKEEAKKLEKKIEVQYLKKQELLQLHTGKPVVVHPSSKRVPDSTRPRIVPPSSSAGVGPQKTILVPPATAPARSIR